VRLRPVRPDDAGRLSELYDRLSFTTTYQRFFTVMQRLPPAWARELATVDYQRRLALVAERWPGNASKLIGVARYEPSEQADTAEVALVVEDAWQGRGLGVTLHDDLLAAGEARGIRRFVAYVLGDNRRMLNLLAQHTSVQEQSVESGVVTLILSRAAA
jgi:RimJ/RimL family protein N-acetyltransferase